MVSKYKSNLLKQSDKSFDIMEIALVKAIKENIYNLVEKWITNQPKEKIQKWYFLLQGDKIDFDDPEVLELMKKVDRDMKPNYYGKKSLIYYIPFAIRDIIAKKYPNLVSKPVKSYINSRLFNKYAESVQYLDLKVNDKVILPNSRGIGIVTDKPFQVETWLGYTWLVPIEAEISRYSGVYYTNTLKKLTKR